MSAGTASSSANHHHGPRAPSRGRRGPAATSGFKGVVLQQNGRWGAQIYADHRRVWLGTFQSESDAASAYDSAALRLRGSDSHRNFPSASAASSPTAEAEAEFQSRIPTDALLAMIRDGSYRPKLAQFLLERGPRAGPAPAAEAEAGRGASFRQLFRKELTPSDVGKLNRLVIPKKHAVKHFPSCCWAGPAEQQLVFRDAEMRQWKFRYCYWRSSQSFVFTRGWNRFVKEKRLRENDAVAFYACGSHAAGEFLVIDAVRAGEEDRELSSSSVVVSKNDGGGDENKTGVGIRLFGVQIYG